MPISVGDALSDNHFMTGSLIVSGGIRVAPLQSSFDLAGGMPFMMTQNVRKGQITLTTNGTTANGSFVYVVVASNQILQTDAFALAIASSSVSVNQALSPRAEMIQNGYAVFTIINGTGGTLADDSKIILNWAAI